MSENFSDLQQIKKLKKKKISTKKHQIAPYYILYQLFSKCYYGETDILTRCFCHETIIQRIPNNNDSKYISKRKYYQVTLKTQAVERLPPLPLLYFVEF